MNYSKKKAVYLYPDFIKAWWKQSLVLFSAWKPPFSHTSCWWNGLVWVPGLEEQPKDLWRTLPHQRPFDFRGAVPIYLPPNLCMNHMYTSNLIPVSAEWTDGQKFLKVHYKHVNVARLEVRYIRRSNNNKFWSKIEPLTLQNPSHR